MYRHFDINSAKYISFTNSLCYSFIPSNKYMYSKYICNINCSYKRIKPFPLNRPLRCKVDKGNFNDKLSNRSIKMYVFNTTTYGEMVKNYRFFYSNKIVYI